MPIPLGILAAAGVRPAAGGSYELIETVTVGSGGAASVTFSNLNTYSTTYQHLQIRMLTKDTSSGAASYDQIRINGDSTNSYSWHRLQGDGSGVASTAGTSTNGMNSYLNAYSSATNAFSAGIIDILDPYETGKNRVIRVFSGGALGSFNYLALASGMRINTASVTSVSVHASANFVQGSRFSIYGLKASA